MVCVDASQSMVQSMVGGIGSAQGTVDMAIDAVEDRITDVTQDRSTLVPLSLDAVDDRITEVTHDRSVLVPTSLCTLCRSLFRRLARGGSTPLPARYGFAFWECWFAFSIAN